jgi:enoyl-CoA hydratase/carnithine racemase
MTNNFSPPWQPSGIRRPLLEEYAEKYKDFFLISRENGIIEIYMHTNNGSAVFGVGLHNAWGQLWQDVGNDPENEVMIFGGTGDQWIGGFDANSFAKPFHQWSPEAAYEHYYDGIKLLENLVFGIDIPTIGVLNGAGPRKEIALLCDITICAEDVTIADGNFSAGSAPGDGMHLALQELLGAKRAAYALYTNEKIDAQKALELGLVNEIANRSQLQIRARELAAQIMKQPRAARRLAHANIQRPWKRRLADDQGFGFAHQLFGSRL